MVAGTVLLVENEGPVRAYLEQQLADDGFEVLAADRTTQALDLAEEVKVAELAQRWRVSARVLNGLFAVRTRARHLA